MSELLKNERDFVVPGDEIVNCQEEIVLGTEIQSIPKDLA